jgi:hypothetical protein
MSQRTAQTSVLAAVATIATALGACAVAASVMAPVNLVGGSWATAGCGVAALAVGLPILWVLLAGRDRQR